MRRSLLFGLALVLAACAGREPEPVTVQTDRDLALSCPGLVAEKDGNAGRVRALNKEEDGTDSMNLVVGSVTTVFPPAAIAFDVSDAQEVEISALHRRNSHLEDVRIAKGCLTEPLVPQGYVDFERSEERYTDANGRVLTLRSNRYIYGRPRSIATDPRQQLGRSSVVPQE